jgi:hypothetical protein
MWTPVGEDITETVTGTGIGGTMNGFLTNDFDRTGRTGKIIAIGKGREVGVSRTIDRDRNNRGRNWGRNWDSKGNYNITRSLKFRNGDNHRPSSRGDSPRLSSLRFNSHGDSPRPSSLRFSSNGGNLRRKFNSHNALSLKEDLKEGR